MKGSRLATQLCCLGNVVVCLELQPSQAIMRISDWYSAMLWGTLPSATASPAKSIAVDLKQYLNAKAFGSYPGEASLDPAGNSMSMPSFNGTYKSTSTGIEYNILGYTGVGNPDNVLCNGQTIAIGNETAFSTSMLLAYNGNGSIATVNFTLQYSDGTIYPSEVRAKPWLQLNTMLRGDIILPYYYTTNDTNWNATNIYEVTMPLDLKKSLTGVQLPWISSDGYGVNIFALSLWQGSDVQIQNVRPTQQTDGKGNQLIELTVNNAGTECLHGSGMKVWISAPGVTTVEAAKVKRLCPGDQKRAYVVVSGTYTGTTTISLNINRHTNYVTLDSLEFGLTNYTKELESVARHESPQWFNDAKYGIFIHWGPYAVSGWGNSTPYEKYAEWFWYYTTHHPEDDVPDCYDYRLRTFGPDWKYDDSFPDYDASAFDPKAWVDLFADAGAKYFVFTSKHHDGFANFETKQTSNRNSLIYGPKRDILKELFDAAKKYQPGLKRGTYFSLPEWFNPDYGKYGFDLWPGIIARNPYTHEDEPYTGLVPVGDYLEDIQLPQMDILAYDYETDMLWCDIGGPNISHVFASNWFNTARAQGREVTMNSRCGLIQTSDFDTPEYATFSTAQLFKWESNRGMDPFSYGYNRATPDDQYMNASTIISSLVDIIAKNGNFLLDVGPMANGTIVQAEVDNLRQAGTWIRRHEEAIFNTTYWFVQTEVAEEGIRFTQTNDAFYVIFLERPVLMQGKYVVVNADVPILKGDKVSMVGVEDAESLDWTTEMDGSESMLQVAVNEEMLETEEYGWVFKIEYLA